jgi:hypothetical protein
MWGQYLRLGPLGTAMLPADRPRVLLIDELDKSDVDLPNDLLNVFEEGRYDIPQMTRLPESMPRVPVMTADPDRKATIERGQITLPGIPDRRHHQQRRAGVPARVPAPLRAGQHPDPRLRQARRHRGRPSRAGRLRAARATATQAADADAWGTGAAPRRRALAGRGAGRRLQRVHGDRVAYRRRVGTSCWCARPPSAA